MLLLSVWGKTEHEGLHPSPVVELGSLFLVLPLEIRCCSASKKAWGMWNTSGSGLPAPTRTRRGVRAGERQSCSRSSQGSCNVHSQYFYSPDTNYLLLSGGEARDVPRCPHSPRLEQWSGAGVSNPPGTTARSCPPTQPEQSSASGVRGGLRRGRSRHF